MDFIRRYFNQTKKYSTLRFILELSATAFFLKVVAITLAIPILSFFGVPVESNLELEKSFLDDPLPMATALIILFATFETFIGQMLILWFAKKISDDVSFRLLLSALVFALLHVEPIIIAAVFPIGLVLAWAYLVYREKSRWSAIWVTTAIHVIHNLFALWLVSLG